MADRPALTFRTLAIAAFGVLLLAPQSVVHPSFQMSFAATLALIAAYERGLPWMTAGADTSWGARVALWGGREIVALILASLVAGLATTPYAAFHFHRLAPYGVIANLLAMPIVSVWVMPMGLLGLIAIPFGFDGLFWRLMGDGIDWMIAVALFVAHLPGAVGRMAAFGSRPAAARHRRARAAVPAEDAAALERRRVRGRREPVGGPHAAAGCAGLGRRGAGVRGADGGSRHAPPRRLRRQGMARRRRRRAAADDKTWDGLPLRRAGCIAGCDGKLFAGLADAFEEDCRRPRSSSPRELPACSL